MSTAIRNLDHATILEFTIATGETVGEGMPVGYKTATTIEELSSDLFMGVALKAGDGDVAKSARIPVALSGVAAVKVGTGGATAGKKAIPVATGFEDAPAHDSSGATDNIIAGQFLETGAAGDMVGMQIIKSNRGSA